jgi:FlaA1/EpsC-like NDP-sugar epimerase
VQGLTNHRRLQQIVLATADALALLAAGLAAAWIRFGGEAFEPELAKIFDHPGFIAYAILVQIGLAVTFNLYRPENWRTRDYVLARIAALGVSLAIALALGTYLVLPWRFGRGLLALTLLISLPIQTLTRFLWLAISALPPARAAVVIGDGRFSPSALRRPSALLGICRRRIPTMPPRSLLKTCPKRT